MTLNEVFPDESAVVLSVDSSDAIGRRLLEMGFVPGTQVTVLRAAPLGDPVHLSLRGYTLMIRRSRLSRVAVRGCDKASRKAVPQQS